MRLEPVILGLFVVAAAACGGDPSIEGQKIDEPDSTRVGTTTGSSGPNSVTSTSTRASRPTSATTTDAGAVQGAVTTQAERESNGDREGAGGGSGSGGGAVAIGATAAAFDVTQLASWVPVVTTASAAVVAHAAASRYDHQIIEYLRTADRLSYLRDTQRAKLPDQAFVDACEDVISIENRAWMARWNTPPDT